MALDKKALVARVLEQLLRDRNTLMASARETRAGAIHEESRPENDKDTRGLEASYLARGQAARVEEMEEAIARLRHLDLRQFGPDDEIDLSALVEVEVDEEPRLWFLAPAGGGIEVTVGERTIQFLTPAAPMGRALIGKVEGDDFEIKLGPRRREIVIVSVE